MNERYERGLARQAELGGTGATRRAVYEALADTAPDLPRLAVEFAYGDILPRKREVPPARPGLDAASRELVTLGALIALGGVEPQLEAHIGSALNAGLEPREVVEAILQALPYAGFPRVFAATAVAGGTSQPPGWGQVFEARDLLPVTG